MPESRFTDLGMSVEELPTTMFSISERLPIDPFSRDERLLLAHAFVSGGAEKSASPLPCQNQPAATQKIKLKKVACF
jgi:hypothetical protein